MTDTWVDERRIDVRGRAVAVRQSGTPDGRPVVYHHGTPSCRLDTAFADDVAADLDVRLVSFDRPGYGESAPASFSLSSIAGDTASIADELGIGPFATLGQSGGGPFSLACAAVLGERVTRVGVAGGPAPYQEMPGLLETLDDGDRKALDALPDEETAAALFAVGFEPFRQLAHASDADILAGFKRMLSPHDAEVLDRPELGGALAAAMRGAMPHGTSGAGWDNVAWVGPWDVDLDAIAQPVWLWYGGEDPLAAKGAGEWLDQRLPTATLVLRPGDGHTGVMEHAREILTTLVSD
jgi:pimeloyl-ACP methyl ester carboxylesterase